MAQWIPDPQGRQEVEKVSKNLKLPVWQPWYKGKFRDFWNEVWGKIDDSYGLLKTLADGKVSKTGDTMTGQLEIKINPQHTADFLYLYRNNDKIASLGGGADDFFIHNSVANTTLQMKNNGYAFYPALNLETISKEVVGAINEVLRTKEPKITKKSGFNLEKSDSITLNDTNKLATSRAVNLLNDKKIDKTTTSNLTFSREGYGERMKFVAKNNSPTFMSFYKEGTRKAFFGFATSSEEDNNKVGGNINKI